MAKLLWIALGIATLTATSSGFSAEDCLAVLTNDYTVDSQSFQLKEHEVDNDDAGIEYATRATEELLGKLECSEFVIDAAKSDCKEIMKGYPESQVCYISADIGYFIIAVDMLGSVNLIYNRWD